MCAPQLFVGIDIAAKTFTVSWTTDGQSHAPVFSCDQDTAGFARLDAALTATGIAPAHTLIVMEATGSYWVALAVHLHEAGYAVSIVNPKHLRHYVLSLPRRAKTDALDAILLAQYAEDRRPHPWTPPDEVYHELRQRLVTRETLVTMRQQARNQHHAIIQWPVTVDAVITQLEAVIADLDQRIATLDKELSTLLRDSVWAPTATLLLGIPGIGVLTAAWLLVASLHFTVGDRAESLAAYAGLVPMDHQSGTSIRRQARIGPGGHARLRRVVYLAAVVACRYNPALKVYDERLLAAGKPKKVARCAVARKLIHQAWAVATTQQPFDPTYHERTTHVTV